MKNNFIVQIVTSVLAVFILWGCANQQPPEGGPIDRTTPVIVSTYPDSSSMLNYKDHSIRLQFDRYVDERSVEDAIFISPPLSGLEFDWSGKELDIMFSDTLRPNTTYVINIGTDVEDLIKNKMAHAFSFAFSTGTEIDRGAIEGRVYPRNSGDEISGIMIFAYRLDNVNPDTLNPILDKPDFITQTGKTGDFFLHHIPFGNYRVYAIRDEYRNLVYDREIDEYAVPSGKVDISSTDTMRTGVLMKLAKEDTTGPRLMKVTALNRTHVVAEFSKSVRPSTVILSSFTAVDTLNQHQLDLVLSYPVPTSSNSFVVITEKQDSGRVFRFSVNGITDSAGNRINPLANSSLFHSSFKPDTLPPRVVSVSIKDSVVAVELLPELSITFSDAVAKSTSLDWINLFDNNKHQLPVEKKWMSAAVVSLRPEKELLSHTMYTLRAEFRSVHDWAGRVCHDSTKVWRFETLDIEDLSSVEGTIVDDNKIDTAGQIFVSAIQVGSNPPKHYVAAADATGKFLIPQIAEGSYVFQSFRDRNGNGKYDPGKPFPFVYSERFSMVSDTLDKVRARWPLEGVRIVMK